MQTQVTNIFIVEWELHIAYAGKSITYRFEMYVLKSQFIYHKTFWKDKQKLLIFKKISFTRLLLITVRSVVTYEF